MTADKGRMEERLAFGLGLFSIGLGVAQILAPRRVSKAAGMKKNNPLMRIFGLREVFTGMGILSQRKTANWLWGRVAGDALDLAVLGATLASVGSRKRRKALAATAAVVGVTALDVYCSRRMSKRSDRGTKTIHVARSIIIDRSADDLYDFWHHFERLGIIMRHLQSVEAIGRNRWHWIAKAPAGRTVEWDAEVTEDIPNHLIAWRSLPGADVDNWGVVRFEPAPGARGTLVRVEMEYSPPGGIIGAKIAKLFGEAPEQQINVDLRQFKQLMETGEIARTEGQPAGRQKSTSKHDEFVRR